RPVDPESLGGEALPRLPLTGLHELHDRDAFAVAGRAHRDPHRRGRLALAVAGVQHDERRRAAFGTCGRLHGWLGAHVRASSGAAGTTISSPPGPRSTCTGTP